MRVGGFGRRHAQIAVVSDTVIDMTAAAAHPPPGQGPPFADASPAQVRAALIPEEAAEFERQWREVITRATESLDLTEVFATLDSWRRVAWLTGEISGQARR